MVGLFAVAAWCIAWLTYDWLRYLRDRASVEIRNLTTHASEENVFVSHVEVRWRGQEFFIPFEARKFFLWGGKKEYVWKSKDDFEKFFYLPSFVQKELDARMHKLSAEHFQACKEKYIQSKVAS